MGEQLLFDAASTPRESVHSNVGGWKRRMGGNNETLILKRLRGSQAGAQQCCARTLAVGAVGQHALGQGRNKKGGKNGVFASRGGGVVLKTLDGSPPALPGRRAASLA